MAKIISPNAKFVASIPKYEDMDDVILIDFDFSSHGYIGLQFADVNRIIYIPIDAENMGTRWDNEIKELIRDFNGCKDTQVFMKFFSTPRRLRFTKDIITLPNGRRYIQYTPHFVLSK